MDELSDNPSSGKMSILKKPSKILTTKDDEKRRKSGKGGKSKAVKPIPVTETVLEASESATTVTTNITPKAKKTLQTSTTGIKVNTLEQDMVLKSEEEARMCRELIEEFFNEAEDICQNRFLHEIVDQMIVSELRDTWQRIMEANLLDGIVNTEDMLPSTFFRNSFDEPPLPVSRDYWSRGAIEECPSSHRESVLDPFIRRKMRGRLLKGDGDNISEISSVPSIEDFTDSTMTMSLTLQTISEETSGAVERPIVTTNSKEGLTIEPRTEVAQKSDHSLVGDGDAQSIKIGGDVSSVAPLENQRSLDVEERELLLIKHAVSITSSKSNHAYKPWTVSRKGRNNDCAGKVFKLIRQTTDEAMLDYEKNQEKRQDQNGQPHKTFSEPDLSHIEVINKNDAGTETLYERTQTGETETKPIDTQESQIENSGKENLIIGEELLVDVKMTQLNTGPEEQIKDVGDSTISLKDENNLELVVVEIQELDEKVDYHDHTLKRKTVSLNKLKHIILDEDDLEI